MFGELRKGVKKTLQRKYGKLFNVLMVKSKKLCNIVYPNILWLQVLDLHGGASNG